jgi:hypothetical protein
MLSVHLELALDRFGNREVAHRLVRQPHQSLRELADQLLQSRTNILNIKLEKVFSKWYRRIRPQAAWRPDFLTFF